MESERKIVEKCGNYKWPKILKWFNQDYKKLYWKSSMKNIRAQKVQWKAKYFEKNSKHHEY